jgi:hypothetical protein
MTNAIERPEPETQTQKEAECLMPKGVYPSGGPVTLHQEYAQTGHVDMDRDFGVLPHNHRDGYSHNDGKHRQPGGMKDRRRGHSGRTDTDFHRNPETADHGPFSGGFAAANDEGRKT